MSIFKYYFILISFKAKYVLSKILFVIYFTGVDKNTEFRI